MFNRVFILLGAIVLLVSLYIFLNFRKKERKEFGIVSKRIAVINNIFHVLILFFFIGYLIIFYSLRSNSVSSYFELMLSQILFWGSVFVIITILLIQIMFEHILKAKLNQIDNLTSLSNKIAGNCKIDDLLLSSKYPIYLSLFDIDNFKKLNDYYGHLIGDEVLVSIANSLKKYINSEEIACRFGGDEFVVAFCNRNEEEVLKILESIRVDIMNISAQYEKANMSVSIGLSYGLGHGAGGSTTYKELMQNADKALYHVKKNGKNSIHIYNEDSIQY